MAPSCRFMSSEPCRQRNIAWPSLAVPGMHLPATMCPATITRLGRAKSMDSRKRRVVIAGCSGHARVVVDAIEAMNDFSVVGFLDTYKSPGLEMLGYELIGSE